MTEPFRIIAGSGRSGTTWVLDAIAQSNGLRTIFEPLHPSVVAAARPYCSRFISDDADMPELYHHLDQVARGQFKSFWSDFRIRSDRLRLTRQSFSSKQDLGRYYRRWRSALGLYQRYRTAIRQPNVITKFIRANLMLGWIRRNFDARIVFLVRHPLAVVESQLRLGGADWNARPVLDHYRQDLGLRRYSGDRYGRYLEQELTPAQGFALAWCIENQIPMEQAQAKGYGIVFYERLRAEPDQEWKRVIDTLELKNVPDPRLLKKPSQQASARWRRNGTGEGRPRWREQFGEENMEAIDSMFQELSMTAYGTTSLEPVGFATC